MVALHNRKKLEKERKERAVRRRNLLIVFGFLCFVLVCGMVIFGVTMVAQNNRRAITQEGIRSLSYGQYVVAARQLQEGSDAGEPTAAAFLAWMKISMGDYEDAYKYAKRAVALEEVSAYEILGDLALLGVGDATGPIAALSYFEQGSVKMAVAQAQLLAEVGTKMSLATTGSTELSRLAQLNDSNGDGLLNTVEANGLASALLSHMVNRGLTLVDNEDDFYTLVLNASKKGVTSLELPLGDMMFLGNDNLSSNAARAVEYWKTANEKGIKAAVTRMAGAYWHGYSIPRDPRYAIELYHQAAGYKDPVAFYALGLIYLRQACDPNQTVNRDNLIQEALNYFSQSSSLGYGPASTALGVFSLTESSAPEDMQKGVQWLQIAALEQGDIAGRVIYDLLEITGTGVQVNFTAGFDDLVMVAKSFPPAQSILDLIQQRKDNNDILFQVLVCANQVIKGYMAYREGDPVFKMEMIDPDSGQVVQRPFDFYTSVTSVSSKIRQDYGDNNFRPVSDLSRLSLNGKPLMNDDLAKVIIQYNPSTGTQRFVATQMMPRPLPPIVPHIYEIGDFVPPTDLLTPATYLDETGGVRHLR